jgi:hypothetical protein
MADDKAYAKFAKEKEKKVTKASRGPVKHMHIEKADNGTVAETHFHPKGGVDMYPGPPPKRKVFTDPDELGKHVAKTFGGGAPAPAPGEEAGESPAVEAGEQAVGAE